MSKKSKGVILDSTPSYGKTRQRHDFMQDYEELQKEAEVMRIKLKAAKRRKLLLASEVGFLRRKYKHLIKRKNSSSSRELSVSALKQIDRTEDAKHRRLPVQVSHKKQFTGKQVAMLNTSPVTVIAQRKGTKEATGILNSDSNRKSRMFTSRAPLFDLNEVSEMRIGLKRRKQREAQ